MIIRALATGLIGLAVSGVLLFLPARTFDYWQAWVFLTLFTIATLVPSIYLGLKDPAVLERRMRFGPAAETRTVQKWISAVSMLSFPAVMVFSAIDHRMGWSRVPPAISVMGDALVVIGLGISMLTILQNRYAAANIIVEAGQELVSTGLYGLVRHPMYLGALVMSVGIPVALDSWWGLLVLIPAAIGIVYRIRDEEQMLGQQLPGYIEYESRVRYRMLPYVW